MTRFNTRTEAEKQDAIERWLDRNCEKDTVEELARNFKNILQDPDIHLDLERYFSCEDPEGNWLWKFDETLCADDRILEIKTRWNRYAQFYQFDLKTTKIFYIGKEQYQKKNVEVKTTGEVKTSSPMAKAGKKIKITLGSETDNIEF